MLHTLEIAFAERQASLGKYEVFMKRPLKRAFLLSPFGKPNGVLRAASANYSLIYFFLFKLVNLRSSAGVIVAELKLYLSIIPERVVAPLSSYLSEKIM